MFTLVGKIKLNIISDGRDPLFTEDCYNELLSAIKSGKIESEISSQPSYLKLDNLSPARENIIRWYPFKENADILELNAQCGAVTSHLASKAGHLVSVTDSTAKAKIIAERNQDTDNLEIYSGKLGEVLTSIDKKFDYAVLIGGVLTKEELRLVKSALKDDGKLLIATENRLGVKYLAGCRDGITKNYYDSVNNYYNAEPKTYDRLTWSNLLTSVGFNDFTFKYPYPDYRMCETIFSDKHLPSENQLTNNLFGYEADRVSTFNETNFFNYAINANCFGEFSNSFFIEVGNDSGMIFVKFSNERNPDKRIFTVLTDTDNGISVKKYAATKKAVEYIKNLKSNEQKLADIYTDEFNIPSCTIENDYAEFDFISGKPLSALIDKHIAKKQMDELYNDLDILKKAINRLSANEPFTPSAEFTQYFGEYNFTKPLTASKYSFIDLIADNLIINDKINIIDYEWTFDFSVPVEFIAFRSLFTSKGISTLSEQDKRKVYAHLGADYDMFDTFLNMEIAFQNRVSSPTYDLQKIYSKISNKVYDISRIDFSKSHFISEVRNSSTDEIVISQTNCNNDFLLRFFAPDCDEFVFFPAEESLFLNNLNIIAYKGEEKIEITDFTHNADYINGLEMYFTSKPIIKIKNNGYDRIEIRFVAYLWNSSIISNIVTNTKSINELIDEVNNERYAHLELHNHYTKLDEQYNALYNQFNEFKNTKVFNLIPIKSAIKKLFKKK